MSKNKTEGLRDERGLLKGVEYKFLPDGRVDWRAMVPKEFIVVNREKFEKYQKPVPASIDGLKDSDLLIKLGGFKELLRLRGFRKVDTQPIVSTPEFASVKTIIEWAPNFESDFEVQTYSYTGESHDYNTSGFSKAFKTVIATNRSFVRTVRDYLGIEVYGFDEIDEVKEKESEAPDEFSPKGVLAKLLKNNNVAFENFKNRMIKEEIEGAGEWKTIEDIESELVPIVTGKMRAILEDYKKKKKDS